MRKTKKTFGEIWSELNSEQTEFLRDYINRQRQDAVSQQRELLVALIKWFRTDGLYYSKTEEEVVDEFLAANCS